MITFIVRCYHRIDDGITTNIPTHYQDVKIIAQDERQARQKAIDAMYARYGHKISHVQPKILKNSLDGYELDAITNWPLNKQLPW